MSAGFFFLSFLSGGSRLPLLLSVSLAESLSLCLYPRAVVRYGP